ncbi:holin [Alteromonas sp. 76-1]|uniref:holin n=1 Tax=Alteromonas sp. 76-1 TaxID=2358187 RepID=UPI0018D4F5CB|nr:holin [Alteromonas sp. 76-1]
MHNHVVDPTEGHNNMHTYDDTNRPFTMTDKASMTTYAGSALSAVWGVMTSQEFGILAGVLIGVVGLLVNIYFKLRDDRYKQAEEFRKQQLHTKMMNPDEAIDTTHNHL